MKLVDQLKNRLMYPAAYTYIAWQSNLSKIKSWGKKDQVRFAQPYAGQKIMLMALYQKGRIRDDVVAAMSAARALGIYVIGVNTLKLGSPDDYSEVMDCYIERYNFGRDFGSYKSGFSYIYANSIAEKCPRLLMINDSLFFSKKYISSFLQDMLIEDAEVLGATENFEIEHHLGSFCIAMNGSILNHKKLKSYWKGYKCSDVRPLVIKTGEMKLSKVLRGAVSCSEGFRSLYDTARVAQVLQSNPVILDSVADLSRNSTRVDWSRFSFSTISSHIFDKYLHSSATIADVDVKMQVRELSAMHLMCVTTVAEYQAFMLDATSNASNASNVSNVSMHLTATVRAEVIAHFIDCFSQGSQIHQNNTFLHSIGLPIIKLDGIYRGMFNSRDIEKLTEDLDADQQDSFRRIMYSRPFGGSVLTGWKLAAFMRGLI
jgi:hypothetical protein